MPQLFVLAWLMLPVPVFAAARAINCVWMAVMPRVYAEGLAGLADRAAGIGARVALESFPFSDMNSPARAAAAVKMAGRSNAGLCIDIWHVERGGITLDEIRAIPGKQIAHVELNDAAAHPVGSLLTDSVDNRRLCGEGGFNLQGFVDAVRSTGYDGAWGVEIVSAEHRSKGLGEAVIRAYETAQQVCFA